MPARELIEGVVSLEATRLYSWARDYVYPHTARAAVHEAFCQLLFAAATGCATLNGPYAYLVQVVHQQLAAAVKDDVFYVPANAHLTAPLPAGEELYELCLVFGLTESAAADDRLSLGQLYSLLHHLRTAELATAGGPAAAGAHAAGTVGRHVRDGLVAHIDRMMHVRGDLYDAALAYAGREHARALAWHHQIPSQRRL